MNEYIENWEEFTDWFNELKTLGAELFGYGSMSQDDWKDYFNDGYSPKEALNEDLSNG